MGMAANKGPTCVVVIGLSVGLAWVFFALRLCERTFISRCWAAEDLLLVAAVLNRLTKVSIAAILALGLLAGVSTMVRIRYIKYSTITDNFLFETAGVAIWSTVEASLGIIAASAYTLRPLLRALFPVFHSQRCSSQTRGNQNIEMCLPARTVAADGSRSELNGSDDLNQQGCGTIGESSNDRDSGISVLKSFEVNTN
ncbi:hypothetical protein V499_03617 [Pseudogymnoascus sp. VKM F-103]|nr:hypothetical protein V499_03617 [Pseudogymnoascus sp. VKM F-103]